MDQYADMNVRIANYRFVEEANNRNIDLSQLSSKCGQLEKENEELRKKTSYSPAEAELFALQEQAVKDNPNVQEAYKHFNTAKIHASHRVLMAHDKEYRDAYDHYCKVVTDEYVSKFKGTGKPAPTEVSAPQTAQQTHQYPTTTHYPGRTG